jgi:hypothetical protein
VEGHPGLEWVAGPLHYGHPVGQPGVEHGQLVEAGRDAFDQLAALGRPLRVEGSPAVEKQGTGHQGLAPGEPALLPRVDRVVVGLDTLLEIGVQLLAAALDVVAQPGQRDPVGPEVGHPPAAESTGELPEQRGGNDAERRGADVAVLAGDVPLFPLEAVPGCVLGGTQPLHELDPEPFGPVEESRLPHQSHQCSVTCPRFGSGFRIRTRIQSPRSDRPRRPWWH